MTFTLTPKASSVETAGLARGERSAGVHAQPEPRSTGPHNHLVGEGGAGLGGLGGMGGQSQAAPSGFLFFLVGPSLQYRCNTTCCFDCDSHFGG